MGVIAPITTGGNNQQQQQSSDPYSGSSGVITPLSTGMVRSSFQNNTPSPSPQAKPTPQPSNWQFPNPFNVWGEVQKAASVVGQGIGAVDNTINQGISTFNKLPGVSTAEGAIKNAFDNVINYQPNGTMSLKNTFAEAINNFRPLGAATYAPANNNQPGNVSQLSQKVSNDTSWFASLNKDAGIAMLSLINGATINKPLPQGLQPKTLTEKIIYGVTNAAGNIYTIGKLQNIFAKFAYGNATVQSILTQYPKLAFLPGFLSQVAGFDVRAQLDPTTKDRFTQFLTDAAMATIQHGTGSIPNMGKLPAFAITSPINFGVGYALAKLHGASNEDALIAGGIMGGLDIAGRLHQAAFAARVKNGTIEMTPDEVLQNVPGGKLENTPLGKDLIKAALEARDNSQNVTLQMGAQKEPALQEMFGVGKQYRGVGYNINLTDASIRPEEQSFWENLKNDVKGIDWKSQTGGVWIPGTNKTLTQLDYEAAKQAYMQGDVSAENNMQEAGERITGRSEVANFEDAVNNKDYELARSIASDAQSSAKTDAEVQYANTIQKLAADLPQGQGGQAGFVNFNAKVELPSAITNEIKGFTSTIPDNELYIDNKNPGKYDNPQAVVGLVNDTVTQNDIADQLKGTPPITITLGRTVVESTPTHEILKVQINKNPELQGVLDQIQQIAHPSGETSQESSQPQITTSQVSTTTPAIPIATLQKGSASQFANNTSFEGLQLTLPSLAVQTTSGKQLTVPLTSVGQTTSPSLPTVASTDKGLSPGKQSNPEGVTPAIQQAGKGSISPSVSVPIRKEDQLQSNQIKNALYTGNKPEALKLYNGYKWKGIYRPRFSELRNEVATEFQTNRHELATIQNQLRSNKLAVKGGVPTQLLKVVRILSNHFKNPYQKFQLEGKKSSEFPTHITRLAEHDNSVIVYDRLTQAKSFDEFTKAIAEYAKKYDGEFKDIYASIEKGEITQNEYNQYKSTYESIQAEGNRFQGVPTNQQSTQTPNGKTAGESVQSTANRQSLQDSANTHPAESPKSSSASSGHDQTGEVRKSEGNEPEPRSSQNGKSEYANRSRNGAVSSEPVESADSGTGRNEVLEKTIRQDFVDRLRGAEEFKKELQDNGYHPQVSPNGTVTIYHGASEDRYNTIMQSGKIEPDTFFSHAKTRSAFGSAGANQYGKVLSIQVDPRDIFFNRGTGEIEAPNGLVRGIDNIWRAPERENKNNTEFANEGVKNTPKDYEPTPESHTQEFKSISPSLDKFINEDVIPATTGIKPWLQSANHEIRSFMFPASLADTKALNLVFTYKGDNDFFRFINRAKYKRYSLLGKQVNLIKYWDKFNKKDHQAFYDNFEHAAPQNNPAWRALDQMYRARYDAIYDKLSEYKELNKIDNYFRRMWEVRGKSEKDFEKYNTLFKKSLQGDLSWTKHRFYKFYMDAVKTGLIAKETNPEIVTEIAEENAARFEHAQQLWQNAKLAGKLSFIRVGQAMPPGFARIDDRIAKVYLPPEIPVKEAFDQNVWDKLNNFAKDFGIEHERKTNFRRKPGGAWGYTYKDSDKVITKFASPSSVLAHELGHQLDFKYNLQDKFMQNATQNNELRALSDKRYEGYEDQVPTSFKQYVRQGAEKMAVMLESYIHAPELFRETAPTVYKEFTDFLSSHKELQPLLDIKPSLVLGSRMAKVSAGGAVVGGDWVGEENFTRLLNNHLSSDRISNSVIGRMLQTQKALFNGLQLSMSGFHPQFLGIDTIANKLNIAERQVVSGDFKNLPRTIGTLPVGLLDYYLKGNDVFKKAVAGSPEHIAALQLAARAGSHITQPEAFQATVLDNFIRNMKQGNFLGGLFRAPYATIEGFYRPLFGELIPKAKVGVFLENYAQALIDRGSDLTTGKTDELSIAREIWRDVEDRMGELNYDNLFWNNTFKGGVQVMMRAPGWFKGTLATLGGGVKDDAQFLSDLTNYIVKKGDKPVFTQRGQYVFNLLAVIMGLGAVYQYLHTRKWPQTLKDYFMPLNGAVDAAGNEIRVIFASYFKDAISLMNNPYQYAANKTAPEINLLLEELQNKDFFGNEVRNSTDPVTTQIMQSLQFALKTGLTPFSYQQSTQQPNLLSKIESLSGIMKAPSQYIKSDKQKAAEKAYENIHGLPGAKTPEQQDIAQLKIQARDEIVKNGWKNSPAFRKLMDNGILKTQRQRIDFIKSAKLTSTQRLIQSLPKQTRAQINAIQQ